MISFMMSFMMTELSDLVEECPLKVLNLWPEHVSKFVCLCVHVLLRFVSSLNFMNN